jgi:hypothetical protein
MHASGICAAAAMCAALQPGAHCVRLLPPQAHLVRPQPKRLLTLKPCGQHPLLPPGEGLHRPQHSLRRLRQHPAT